MSGIGAYLSKKHDGGSGALLLLRLLSSSGECPSPMRWCVVGGTVAFVVWTFTSFVSSWVQDETNNGAFNRQCPTVNFRAFTVVGL